MKQIFIWKRLGKVSDSYHSEGGLVVVAKDYNAAMELLKDFKYVKIEYDPDYIYDTPNEDKDRVIVFPDAGCC